jgi:4-hydroxy-4-methyl-2-oxoglutarate aldolase
MTDIHTDAARTDGRDLDLVRRLDQLYVAVVSDCLDSVGVRDNVMETRIRPLFPEARIAGYAATVQAVPVDAPPADPADYYKGELEAVDALQPGDVMVVSTCLLSYWGELLSTAATRRGAAGLVADAYTRDTTAIAEMGFPVFVAGIQAQDSLGRVDVSSYGEPVDCGGVRVNQGDLILADHDGVVVIPAAVAEEVIVLAEKKVATENEMRADLAGGMPVSAAFQAYGVL